ncbi:MAG TPA: molybdopterin-dependent oxidoreductase [Stellaceae bacterium]|nr:molybdopterin-dependent oxidoreductase [Stellaceae bacterium]
MTHPEPVGGARNGIRTTCPYCGVGCGVVVRPDGGIVGDPDHPANRGRLCSKGGALAETLAPAGRLTHPEIDGCRASWGEALDLIADTFTRTIREYGPDAVAFYVSGQFLTEDYYVANKLMKGFIGSANIDTNSRLCMASSVAGHIRAFGEDVVPGRYEDIEAADLVVLVGSNLAWCHPVLFQRLAAAKAERGTRIVVVDPRRTATCEIADLHLQISVGSDVALFNGLLVHLAEQESVDRAWVARHTRGFDAALTAAQDCVPDGAAVAAIAGVDRADIETFFAWFSATDRTVTLYSQGVNQSSSGTDKVNAIINCHLATGRIGRVGAGPFSLTGQPNAMGGREVGGLANQLAAHMSFDRPSDIDRVRRFWQAPRVALRPGLKAVDLFGAALDGRIKALWIMGTNPAASMPRADRVRAALKACPFVVVADCWPTDTTRYAKVVLPAAGWGEKDGTVTNSERRISRQRAFRSAPGDARPDWWMLTEVARRLGWAHAFAYARPVEIFREHAALSAFENKGRRIFNIGAFARITDAEYDRLSPAQWPLPARDGGFGSGRLFGNGQFPTDGRHARFVATPWRPPSEQPDQRLSLLLNTGRVRDQWHTMTRTGRVQRLMKHVREPFLDVHPQDAERCHVADGGLVRVESRHGAMMLRARLSGDQRRGEVFAPMHWTDRFTSSGPVDRLVGAAVDPVSGQPELKATPVGITPVATLWRGVLLRRSEAPIIGDLHWSRIPLAAGQCFELAGWRPLPGGTASEAWVTSLLGAPADAELVIYAEARRGVFRYASIVEERLDACLFIGLTEAGLPDREPLAALLGKIIEPRARAGLVAARPTGTPEGADRGQVVCTCFGVGLQTLHEAIRTRRTTSVAEIGATLRAGSNCGSCLPELERILRDARADAEPDAVA